MSTSSIDISKLPAPQVVEAISFEDIFSQVKSTFLSFYPEASEVLSLESEPLTKMLQCLAYQAMILRQRANDSAVAVMLAYAQKSDLDQIAARFGVPRLLIQPGNPNATPPTEDVYEKDDSFRARIPLSLEGYTTAGSEGSYVFHGMSADGRVKDISAISPMPGKVAVYVLSRDGDGTASEELLAKVTAALNAEKVRPITDEVTVQSSSIVTYNIEATLVLYPGPDAGVAVAMSQAAAREYADSMHRNGFDVALSGIYQALHVPGMVQSVTLIEPTANVIVSPGQAAYCQSINITVAGSDV